MQLLGLTEYAARFIWHPHMQEHAWLYAAGSCGAVCYALGLILYMASVDGIQGKIDKLSNYESRAFLASTLEPLPENAPFQHEWNSFCLNRVHLNPKGPRFAASCSIGDLLGGRRATDHYTMGALKVGAVISPLQNESRSGFPLDLILLVGGEFDETGVAMARRAGWSHICIVDTQSVPAMDTRTVGEWPAGEGGVVKPQYIVTFNRLLLFLLPPQYRAVLYLDTDVYIPDVERLWSGFMDGADRLAKSGARLVWAKERQQKFRNSGVMILRPSVRDFSGLSRIGQACHRGWMVERPVWYWNAAKRLIALPHEESERGRVCMFDQVNGMSGCFFISATTHDSNLRVTPNHRGTSTPTLPTTHLEVPTWTCRTK